MSKETRIPNHETFRSTDYSDFRRLRPSKSVVICDNLRNLWMNSYPNSTNEFKTERFGEETLQPGSQFLLHFSVPDLSVVSFVSLDCRNRSASPAITLEAFTFRWSPLRHLVR